MTFTRTHSTVYESWYRCDSCGRAVEGGNTRLHECVETLIQAGQRASEGRNPSPEENAGSDRYAQWLTAEGYPGYSEDFAIDVHGQWEAQGGGIAEAIDAVRFERS